MRYAILISTKQGDYMECYVNADLAENDLVEHDFQGTIVHEQGEVCVVRDQEDNEYVVSIKSIDKIDVL